MKNFCTSVLDKAFSFSNKTNFNQGEALKMLLPVDCGVVYVTNKQKRMQVQTTKSGKKASFLTISLCFRDLSFPLACLISKIVSYLIFIIK